MKVYLATFSLAGLTVGIVIFTIVFLRDVGMPYDNYKAWLTVLLSFTSLISNATITYYFAQRVGRKNGTETKLRNSNRG